MELRQLRYFVKMVEVGSMTKAAVELYIAQPSLSQQLANLETYLNIRLLDRGVKGVTPTPAGVLFYKYAKKILNEVADARLAMQSELESPTGEVSIAMPSSASGMIAIPLLRTILSKFPGIQLKLNEVPSANIPRLLSRGDIDIALVTDWSTAQEFRYETLLTEQLFAVLPASTDWESDKISVKALSEFPLLLPKKSNSIRQRFDAACAEQGYFYQVAAEINVTSLLALAVRDGLGVSILPWSAVYMFAQNNQVKVKQLVDPIISRDLFLCVSDDQARSTVIDIVLHLIKSVCTEVIAERQWLGVEKKH